MNKRRLTARELSYVALMSVLIALCSWISVPLVVPFTLQTFGVACALLLLGGRLGLWSLVIYLLLGAVGLPVFAGFGAGPGVLLGPLGGYLLGFVLQGLCYWALVRPGRDGLLWQAAALLLGLLLCYAAGTLWFVQVYVGSDGAGISLSAALLLCVTPFVLPDVAKLTLALLLARRLRPLLRVDQR